MISLRISFLWRQKMFVPGWHVDTTWLRILYTYIYIYFLPFKRLCLLGTCCTLYPNLLEPYSVGQLLALQRVFRLNTFLDRLSFYRFKIYLSPLPVWKKYYYYTFFCVAFMPFCAPWAYWYIISGGGIVSGTPPPQYANIVIAVRSECWLQIGSGLQDPQQLWGKSACNLFGVRPIPTG